MMEVGVEEHDVQTKRPHSVCAVIGERLWRLLLVIFEVLMREGPEHPLDLAWLSPKQEVAQEEAEPALDLHAFE